MKTLSQTDTTTHRDTQTCIVVQFWISCLTINNRQHVSVTATEFDDRIETIGLWALVGQALANPHEEVLTIRKYTSAVLRTEPSVTLETLAILSHLRTFAIYCLYLLPCVGLRMRSKLTAEKDICCKGHCIAPVPLLTQLFGLLTQPAKPRISSWWHPRTPTSWADCTGSS